uniref:Uncharacterized protein n=1 Tax=Timema monikensis TaxID=170555 RepID=A0A7R9EC87_9NEOP|nr:unnamed protein product [Timema monikensis]
MNLEQAPLTPCAAAGCGDNTSSQRDAEKRKLMVIGRTICRKTDSRGNTPLTNTTVNRVLSPQRHLKLAGKKRAFSLEDLSPSKKQDGGNRKLRKSRDQMPTQTLPLVPVSNQRQQLQMQDSVNGLAARRVCMMFVVNAWRTRRKSCVDLHVMVKNLQDQVGSERVTSCVVVRLAVRVTSYVVVRLAVRVTSCVVVRLAVGSERVTSCVVVRLAVRVTSCVVVVRLAVRERVTSCVAVRLAVGSLQRQTEVLRTLLDSERQRVNKALASADQSALAVQEICRERDAIKAEKESYSHQLEEMERQLQEMNIQCLNCKNENQVTRAELSALEEQLTKERSKLYRLREDKKILLDKVCLRCWTRLYQVLSASVRTCRDVFLKYQQINLLIAGDGRSDLKSRLDALRLVFTQSFPTLSTNVDHPLLKLSCSEHALNLRAPSDDSHRFDRILPPPGGDARTNCTSNLRVQDEEDVFVVLQVQTTDESLLIKSESLSHVQTSCRELQTKLLTQTQQTSLTKTQLAEANSTVAMMKKQESQLHGEIAEMKRALEELNSQLASKVSANQELEVKIHQQNPVRTIDQTNRLFSVISHELKELQERLKEALQCQESWQFRAVRAISVCLHYPYYLLQGLVYLYNTAN